LRDFLRFRSVSSDPKRAPDNKACAVWLARHLQRIGFERVLVIPTAGNPIVYASWGQSGHKPTLLVYGHYDVVSAGPLSEWHTSPFTPAIKGQDIYARGSSDDKGQLFCHVKAIESYLRSSHALPLNVKCLFEGEEEIGSKNLLPFIDRHRNELRAHAVLISDTRMLGPGQPAISYAQRGGLRAELLIRGPQCELHSGTFGGAVLNPLQALCEIVAKLHDESGRVAIPGFYDDVHDWGMQERAYMARVGPSDHKILHETGVAQEWGEHGYTAYERTTIRPALTLNGISGGSPGPGIKGVIPPRALAKLSFRLVPDQDPLRVAALFREYVNRITPSAVVSSVRTYSPLRAVVVDRKQPALRTASFACKKVFGRAPVFLRSGGSIPVASAFQDVLGIPTVLMGLGRPDDRIHGPNEKFHLPDFYRGIETSIWYMAAAARALSPTASSEPALANEGIA
jgi:acetylornithine deacetylase/succinyl-diaminopimelate desuccinylase-like protein